MADASPRHRPSSWPWLALALALAWSAIERVPLILNASAHLDSDLAVDGLTLLDATRGHWRWHYPGTPHMGTPPVLLSWPQAMAWGANPITLVSGGAVAYGLLIVATFLLNRRAFGPSVAAWGLVPMAFASTGTLWLSGRITGGHLLTAAWHAGAFAMLCDALARGGIGRAAALGFWSGFGLYLDSMTAVTWAGLGLGAVAGWWGDRGGSGRAVACVLAFGLAAGVGVVPKIVGARVDPHDSYRERFDPVTRGDVLADHARILALDCLPRLIAGRRLPGLQAEPEPLGRPKTSWFDGFGLAVAVVSIGLFAGAMIALATDRDPVGRSVRVGLIASSALVLAGFVVNRNIFNSDNYRYLVFLLVPWSSGFGLMMRRRTVKGVWTAGLVAAGFAALMTVDAARWYGRIGWLDGSGRPIRAKVADRALDWLEAHPETRAIFGDYWDVYRLAFLKGGSIQGVPFPEYPDRFGDGPSGRPRTLIVGPKGLVGPRYRAEALASGGREIGRSPGLSVIDWPRPGDSP